MNNQKNIHKDYCSNCAKEIVKNDRCIVVALLKLDNKDIDLIEAKKLYHTWCWLEIAGEDYDL